MQTIKDSKIMLLFFEVIAVLMVLSIALSGCSVGGGKNNQTSNLTKAQYMEALDATVNLIVENHSAKVSNATEITMPTKKLGFEVSKQDLIPTLSPYGWTNGKNPVGAILTSKYVIMNSNYEIIKDTTIRLMPNADSSVEDKKGFTSYEIYIYIEYIDNIINLSYFSINADNIHGFIEKSQYLTISINYDFKSQKVIELQVMEASCNDDKLSIDRLSQFTHKNCFTELDKNKSSYIMYSNNVKSKLNEFKQLPSKQKEMNVTTIITIVQNDMSKLFK